MRPICSFLSQIGEGFFRLLCPSKFVFKLQKEDDMIILEGDTNRLPESNRLEGQQSPGPDLRNAPSQAPSSTLGLPETSEVSSQHLSSSCENAARSQNSAKVHPPIQYDIDPSIEKLVCKTCWATTFSEDSFRMMWADPTSTASRLTYRSPSWSAMQESIEHMCEWCDLLCEHIEVYYQHRMKTKEPPPDDMTFLISAGFQWKESLMFQLVVENDWTPTWTVNANEDDPAGRYIPARGVVWDVDSTSSYNLALACVEDCYQHACCPKAQPLPLPRRVVDCSNPARPRLVVSDPVARELYVALSYVWGEEQPHATQTANFHSYTDFIALPLIPKTILDAITVTHKLGLRYLWVDAFCIIQDSEDDKAHEIPQIRSTFRNAFITIVAAGTGKASDGFLHNRPKWLHAPSTLPFRCPDGFFGTMLIREGSSSPRNEPVDMRAWCLEERVLSPRILMYCSHALQYECQFTRKNLNGSPNFLPSSTDIPRLPDCVFSPQKVADAKTEQEISQSWRYMLSLYTQRSLTKSKDRLVALAGIVEVFHELWPHGDYVAGLWTHQLPGCLLWQSSRPAAKARPVQYRAPSWSWAAVDGEITTPAPTRSDEGVLCKIKDIQVKLKNPVSPYGQVIDGYLLLSTFTRIVVWDPEESELFEKDEDGLVHTTHEDSQRGEIGYVTADAIENESMGVCEVVAAAVVDTGPAILGLILVVSHFDDAVDVEVYRRIGWFTAPFCDRNSWLSSPSKLVKII